MPNIPSHLYLTISTVPITDDDLFAPVIGIDFDNGGASPLNWQPITTAFSGGATDIDDEAGNPTSVDLAITVSGGAASFSGSNPGVVPIHTPSLENLGGGRLSTDSVTSVWSDLVPGKEYNVYVFGRENFSDAAIQTVTITGGTSPTPFVQDTRNNSGVLFVNEDPADENRDLESYAIPVTANASGEITVLVQNPSTTPGQDRVYLAGIAIQDAPTPAAGVTVTESSGTALTESGTTDSYMVALDTTPD